MSPRIAVVGSLVMDLVVWLPRLPRRAETLRADRAETHCGGKGFNQAVTAARLGADVTMVGRVGTDAFGDAFLDALAHESIDATHVGRDPVGIGIGLPMILPGGDNAIVLAPRANMALAPADVPAAALTGAAALLLQLEVPVEASVAAARLARAAGATVLLDPAPAAQDITPLLADGLVDWLIPNEVEAAELLDQGPITTPAEAEAAARLLLDRGPRAGVVVTLGALGAVAVTPTATHLVPALAVDAVDPTAAGDAFRGAFALALADGAALADALTFASAAGAHAVTIPGAYPSLPHRGDL